MKYAIEEKKAAYLAAACALNGAECARSAEPAGEDGKVVFDVGLPEGKRRELEEDVECEEAGASLGGVPVRSYATLTDPEKKARGDALAGTTAYVPYEKDRRRIEEELLGL